MLFCSNMNTIDRSLRGVGGAILVLISPAGLDLLDRDVMAWFCLFFGAANLIAALSGWCFMYSLIGLNSSADAVADDAANPLEKLDFRSLRNKSALGFGAIAVLLATLYAFEAFQAARDGALHFEIKALHDVTEIVLEEVEHKLEALPPSEGELSTRITSQQLLAALYHFDEPMFLLVGDSQGWLHSYKNIEPGLAQQILTSARSQLQLPIAETEALIGDRHERVFHSDTTPLFFEAEAIDGTFIFMPHDVELPGLGVVRVVLGRVSTSSEDALAEVAQHLGLFSLIVFWLAIWGAVGVAYFIWRYVESANRRVYKLATTDQATGLANDYALRELMENGAFFSTERDMKIVGMHLRNLSNIASNTTLKLLNQLLSELGRKLTSGMGEDQYLARLNDGTIILIAPEEQLQVFEQFRQSVNEVQWVGDFQFTLEPTEVQLSYPTDVDSFESLRTAVSQLVASAKKMRIPVLRYDQSLMERSDKLDDYASEISRALHQHEFELYLQPKIDMDERVIVGAETLIRWNHPQDGLLAPGLFMDVIGHSNLRSQFATFVIEETALMAKKLRAEGYMIPLSFNLSADDIFDANVQATLATVAKSLDLQQVPHLEIELIEAQTSINIARIKEALRLINWLGYTVALDDFGTGMSSLSYSNELPVNTIKIDKSFVDRLLVSEGTEPSIRAIMLLAEGYGFNVVAEGVETQEQAETLRTLGCRVAQGYLYSKPVPFDDFKLLCSSAELSCSSAAGSNTA